MKRTVRLLITTALCAVILVQLTYLSRGLFEQRIRRGIESALSEMTGSIVKVGSLRGNWLDHIIVDDVHLVGSPESLLQEVEGLRLELAFSPLDLLFGDLGGLRSCRVTARKFRVRTDGVIPGQSGEAGSGGLVLEDLARSFADGALVEVLDFSYGTGDAERGGNLTIALAPGTGDRTLRIEHSGVRASVFLRTAPAAVSDISTIAYVENAGHLLRCLGIQNEFQQGELGVTCQVVLDPLRLTGQLQLLGAHYLEREIGPSRVSWTLDRDILRVREGILQLAGLSVHTGGLLAPSPLESSSLPLDAVRGDLDLDITDLSPYVDLVPELREWLPVRGRLQAWVEDGRMHIAEAWLQAEGATLQLDRSTIDLALMLDRASLNESKLGFELLIPSPKTLQILDMGELRTSGSFRGTVSGSLSDPRVEVHAELGPTSLGDYRGERLSGTIAYTGNRVLLTNLNAFELGILATTALSQLEGSAELVLNSAGGNTVSVSLQGRASSGWLDLFDVPDATSRSIAAPSFALTASMDLTQAPELSIELELHGPATVDLSGTIPIGAGPLNVSLHAPEQDLGSLTSFLPGGPVDGVFALDLAAQGDTDDIAFDIDLSAVVQDPAARLGFWPVDVLGEAPAGPARLEIRARQTADGIEIDQLLIESNFALISGQGSTPVRWNPDLGFTAEPLDRALDVDFRVTAPGPEGLNLPVVAEGHLRIGAEGTQVQALDLTAGSGHAAGFVATDAGWRDWLFGDPGTKAVSGELTLEDFSLEILPADALGLDVLEGNLSGHADLMGTIERPEPRIEVDVSNVVVRAGSLPRLEDLAAHLTVVPDQVRLENLSGTMGAGPFGGELVLRANGGNLWDSPSETSITGNFRGVDLLVANERNLRLRSHVDLELRGTVEELTVGGSVRISTGRYARRLTLLPDLRARGGTAAALEEFHLLPIDSPLGQRIHFDIEIATDRDFEVRTHFLDCDLVFDLRLRGQASLARLEGVVSSSAGILRLPGTTLLLDSALVTFPQDRPMQPELLANASGRRHGIQIQLNAHGPLQEPEIEVSSIPVFSPQELWTLVTTGVLPRTLQSRGLEGQAALVGGYLAEELAAWYSGDNMEDTTSFFDRFTFVAGRDISESGQESLVVEFSLSELLFLQGERDVYENYNGGIVIRWRF